MTNTVQELQLCPALVFQNQALIIKTPANELLEATVILRGRIKAGVQKDLGPWLAGVRDTLQQNVSWAYNRDDVSQVRVVSFDQSAERSVRLCVKKREGKQTRQRERDGMLPASYYGWRRRWGARGTWRWPRHQWAWSIPHSSFLLHLWDGSQWSIRHHKKRWHKDTRFNQNLFQKMDGWMDLWNNIEQQQ